MKHLLTKSNLLILAIILFAFLLRLYNLHQRTTFDADQEWLAERSASILRGDLALLGPVTSIGGLSIGPIFIYLLTFVNIFTQGAPISSAYLSVFLGMLTVIGLFLFTKYFIDKKTAFLILFLTAISSTFIFWDQAPWAPSLFYVSQLLLLIGSYLSHKNDWGYPVIVLGFVLGFSSHFGIVLSLLSIAIYLLFVRPVKPSFKMTVISLFLLIGGMLPNIVFDLTHNYINFKRMLEIIQGDGFDYFVSFGKIISVLAYNSISLIYPKFINNFDSILLKSFFALILVNGIRLLRDKKYKNISLLLLITIIVPASFFYLTQSKFSEYYLMMTVPSSVLLLALFLKDMLKRKLLIVVLLLISIFLNYKLIKTRNIPWNLKAKEDVAKAIIQKAGYDNYGISLTTKFGEQFGYKYVFDYYGIKGDLPPQKGETRIFSIIAPEGFDGMTGMIDFDGIGLRWQGI